MTMWSPAQVVAMLLGAAACAFGAYALSRTGVSSDAFPGPRSTALGFTHTQFLGFAEVIFGVLMILGGLTPYAGRVLMGAVGAIALGVGVVVLTDAWPARVDHWLGAQDRGGWLFVAAGGLALLTAVLAPTLTFTRRRAFVRRRRVMTEAG